MDRVGIVATGQVGFTSISPGVSYKELVFEAAMRAYAAAGIDPRRDVDSFVCASEDFLEGTSIFDEYVPDQLGAAQRPVQTVAADGLVAVATGAMLIRSGVAEVVACEAHSKASDVVTLPDILAFALDPVFERPLGVHPWFVAGLEMTAAEPRARSLCPLPVWVDGIGWSTESPSLSTRTWGTAEYARRAAERAYAQAGITDPGAEIDVAEVDDTFSYKQLQHLDALGLRGTRTTVNPSGGSLGRGYLFEANGLARVADIVAQLRGQAGACQIDGVRRGVAQSWRGIPTATGAVAVFSVDA